MEFPLRRVVTGHDDNGRSAVLIDEKRANIISKRKGHESYVIWTAIGNPASNDGAEDGALREVQTTLKDGSIFRIMRLSPGVLSRQHRSDSIDYLIVLSGAVTMELDVGAITLSAGDTLVQRGTMHNWIVDGPEPCVMAVVLIDAKPVVAASGKMLSAAG